MKFTAALTISSTCVRELTHSPVPSLPDTVIRVGYTLLHVHTARGGMNIYYVPSKLLFNVGMPQLLLVSYRFIPLSKLHIYLKMGGYFNYFCLFIKCFFYQDRVVFGKGFYNT